MAVLDTPATTTRRGYWQAQRMAELTLERFIAACEQNDWTGRRRAFYLLASYYGRTREIVQGALADRREPLAQAALRNLVVLHRPLAQMHHLAPDAIPLASILERPAREELARDLIVRALNESPDPLSEATIVDRVNEMDLLGTIATAAVRRHLADLEATGHLTRSHDGYGRTKRSYTEMDMDAASLEALLGPALYARVSGSGFRGLTDVEARKGEFRDRFTAATTLDGETVDLVIEAAATLLDTRPPEASPWRHTDLLNSPYPRPYQYEAYAVFRGGGYQGQLVEAPTGSGKTMVGMMCIQDWLRTLRPGQSILVLVPTASYQQQWIGELCYKPVGLRLPPELVFSGTPLQLERFQRRTGTHPAIVLMTYAALAQTGSGVGKGGFDVDSIEIFLQSANVQYVALDEVHKTVEDMRSVSADVTRQLVAWLQDGSIRGLIGFSATAEAYRPRFAELGLNLAHSIPLDTLIGYGFVAPFVEFGVPFANSARERRIRQLLDSYKAHLLAYCEMLGGEELRKRFAAIPLDQRVALARHQLRMYQGRADGDEAAARKLTAWEDGRDLGIAEAPLVTLLQLANGWSDADLARQAGVDEGRFGALRAELESLRAELADLIYLPSTVRRLQQSGFGTELDRDAVMNLANQGLSATARAERTEDLLASTIVGLYSSLTDWFLRAGEGRVEAIKALIEAEEAVRPVSGTLVFDTGKRIRWRAGVTAPGYEGVGGLFSQVLGDPRFSAFAALSSEIYMTYDESNPMPPRVARLVETELMRGEVAQAMFGLTTQGLDLPEDALGTLRTEFTSLIGDYVDSLAGVRARRLGEFRKQVIAPFRRSALRLVKGSAGERFRARLSTQNVHLAELIGTFYDYAQIADSFRRARVGEVEQVSGAHQRFFVVPMPAGKRKQLVYELTARIVDADEFPINLVIVSTWARTGWNVLKPNVLIDATATRDVTAWQQLRARAIRSLRTWNIACFRSLLALRSDGSTESNELAEATLRPIATAAAIPQPLRERIAETGLHGLTEEERSSAEIGLMLSHNKVTHIYELVKAFGSTSQVEYDRHAKVWRRREPIARKHAVETSVDPFTGDLVAGVAHAPLLYASDPRTDLPDELQYRVSDVIDGLDPKIVRGWVAAAGE